MKIENPHYVVEVDPETGALCRVLDRVGDLELIAEPRLADAWRLMLPLPRPGMTPEANAILGAEQKLSHVETSDATLTLRWDGPLKNARGDWDVRVTMHVTLVDRSIEFRLEVDNRSDLVLAEVWHAGLGGMMGLGERRKTETLLPCRARALTESIFRTFPESMGPGGGAGGRFTEFHQMYPVRLDMPWFSMYNPERGRGVYYALARNRMGGNWPEEAELQLLKDRMPAGVVMHWVHLPCLPPGETFTSPPVVLRFHDGDWHDAAKLYREWFLGRFAVRPNEGWLRRTQAVYDLIFMLPEGNVLWRFEDIPALAAEAKRFGIDTFLISGWTLGGMDCQYPAYTPDPHLGTWDDLEAGIRKCHDLGMKVLFFANISPVNVATEWYRDELHKYRVMDGNDVPHPTFGYGMGTLSARMRLTMPSLGSCDPAFGAYRDIIVSKMRKLAAIGADGIHFDKVCDFGMDFNPALPLGPDRAMFEGTLRCLEEVLAACRGINPDFCIGVESSWDRLLAYADAWWTWVDGIDHTDATKFTFPESLPAFAVVQAFDYGSVNNAVRFGGQLLVGPGRWSGSMGDASWRELAEYIRAVIVLRERLKDILFLGEFLDELDAEVEAEEGVRFSVHRGVKAEEGVRFSVHRNPATGRRACVLVNFSRTGRRASLTFAGNRDGAVRIHRPSVEPEPARLPVSLTIAPDRLVVVEETP
ncbi:MAG: hypothetical protein AMS16_07375 [Planctomycetes bacterium DG_58]|nr:MAG: hypothetical protein AMS16_07375 [Planctomycetes bacterium DG_58]